MLWLHKHTYADTRITSITMGEIQDRHECMAVGEFTRLCGCVNKYCKTCENQLSAIRKKEHWLRCMHRLYKRNGRNIRDITHWFVDWCSEANSCESRQRHLENFRCMLGKIKTRILLIWAWGGAMGGAGRLLWLRGLDHEDIGQSTCQSGRSHALMHTLLYRHI